VSRYYIGTAGWSYEDWDGVVYPPDKERGFHPLSYLAAYISIVEVNSTFYRPPVLSMSLFWIKKLAGFPDFLLSVKLHQVFTHERESYSRKDADAFKLGIEPLVAARRLAALLIQFPWSYRNTEEHRDYLAGLFELFAGYPLALEVRHASWDERRFFELLREHHVAFCNIDQPVIGESLRPSAVVTHPDFSYVRFHGRNYKDWFRKDAGRDDRYNYLYAKDELGDWIKMIKDLGKDSDRIYVITNNHYRGQALANALQIKNMVSGEKLEIPGSLLKQYPVLEDIVKKIREGQMDLFKKEDKDKPAGSGGKKGG
jgi:uncharacterized protein YecE (DUF72 family)